MTQQERAETMRVSIQCEQRVESGKANLTLTSLARWAAALRVEPAALFEPATTRSPPRGRPRSRLATRTR